ncbi:helix-turn-helix domain-containing protein [Anatilimnocola floriformis]|uniref:helix-turn-helix domain-containing protein n=1 Tax=Anatilimnocola floriformis TaxID=2948575 RepID=UPI0036F44A3A
MSIQSRKGYYSVREVAELSGLSECTIRRYARAGKIPSYQPAGPGGKLRFPLDCIERSATSVNHTPAAPSRLSGRKPKWLTDHN